jgi:hypothetical protein
LEEEITLSLITKRGRRMFFSAIIKPEQLVIMTEAFEDHCHVQSIVNESARENTAHLVMLLFQSGARTVEEIKAGLDRLRV